ncbi:MAG: MFS transporter [SAR324 cluster bacterium]|nr:MFS transporter [SAR324 cluster bacterium]
MKFQNSMRDHTGSIYYGWKVVLAVFVMLMFSSGLGFYNLSVIMTALIAERGFSVTYASSAITLFFITSGMSGLLAANLMKKYDPRFTITIGSIVGAFSLVAIGFIREIWQLYTVYFIFAVGFSFSSLVPGTTLVANWFNQKRAVALSIASTGLSVGGVILIPLSAKMIHEMGLQKATFWFGVIYFLGIFPITAVFVRSEPAFLKMGMDGAALKSDINSDHQTQRGVPYKKAIAGRYFIIMISSFIVIMMSQVGAIAHLFKVVNDRVSGEMAATAISVLAGVSVISRLIGGWVVHRYISIRSLIVALMLLQAIALTVLAFGTSGDILILGTVAFGMTMGNLLMLQPLLVADSFGLRDYGRIYSFGWMLISIGIAIGPGLMGVLHDLFHGYTIPFLSVSILSLLGTFLLTSADSPPDY